MKKIYRYANWDASEFTTENVTSETLSGLHWFLRGIKTCLTDLGITNVQFTLVTASAVTVAASGYATFRVEHPAYYGNDGVDYIFYVNTETKEIFGCASTSLVLSTSNLTSTDDRWANIVVGLPRTSGSGSFNDSTVGGYLGLKIINTAFRGTSTGRLYSFASGSAGPYPTWLSVGNPLGDRKISTTAPTTNTKTKFFPAPLLIGYSQTSTGTFNGQYFESVYLTNKYYTTPAKTVDNKRYLYNGYAFELDNVETDVVFLQ